MGMFMLLPVLFLGGGMGGANELLDFVQSQSYWQARGITPDAKTLIPMIDANPEAPDIAALIKQLGDDDFATREAASAAIATKGPGVIPQLKEALKSTDAEVVDRAGRLIEQLTGGKVDASIHKLMVIRSLGETKDAAALPALKALVDSKEPFVADYAKRAIGLIEGKPYTPAGTSAATFDKDVWMLPKGVKLVMQLSMNSKGPVNWTKVFADVTVPIPNINKDEMLAEMQKGTMTALGMAGNVRIDGITLGLAGDVGIQTGYVVIYVRGQYDREKVKQAFVQMGAKISDEGGIVTVQPESDTTLLLPSNDLFVIMGGPRNVAPVVIKDVVAAVKAGKGTLGEDEAMVKLIESANRKTGGWAAVQMTDSYRSQPWLAPFDSAIAERAIERVDGKSKTSLRVKATGTDPQAISTAVTTMNEGLEMIRGQMAQAAGFVPKQMIDFLGSIKIQSDGKAATLTGHIEGDFESMLGSMMFPMMMMGGPGR